MNMRAIRLIVIIVAVMTAVSGCYHTGKKHGETYAADSYAAAKDDGAVTDSDSAAHNAMRLFYATHHYAQNYNFVVKADSIMLLRQQPEEKLSGMPTDSFAVKRGTHIVVVDIRMLPDGTADSVWVQVASDQAAF